MSPPFMFLGKPAHVFFFHFAFPRNTWYLEFSGCGRNFGV